MEKRLILIPIFLGLLVVISACGRGGTSTGDSGAAPRDPFIGGSTGLFIEFVKGAPPNEVTDRAAFPFNIEVNIRNDGEFDLKKDQVEVDLLGILPEDFGANPEDLRDKNPIDDPLPKRRDAEGNIVEPVTTSVVFPDTGDTFFTFGGVITGNTEFTLRADVCYRYQTRAVAKICVLRDLINVDDNRLCDPSQGKTVHSSGAPVQVTNFRESVLGKDKIGFSFDISRSGSGDIFKADSSDAPDAKCPKTPTTRRSRENRVKVSVNSGLGNLRCSGLDGGISGHIIMVDGRRTITCTQELSSDRTDFEKNVDITLDYNFNDFKEKRILVKHLLDS